MLLFYETPTGRTARGTGPLQRIAVDREMRRMRQERPFRKKLRARKLDPARNVRPKQSNERGSTLSGCSRPRSWTSQLVKGLGRPPFLGRSAKERFRAQRTACADVTALGEEDRGRVGYELHDPSNALSSH